MTLSLSRPPGPPTIGPGPLTTGGRSDLPPLAAARPIVRCALATTALLVTRRLHQPTENKGRVIRFGDGTAAAVYRETRIEHHASQPVLLVVGFRLRWVERRWSHSVSRAPSVLNTVLFAGFPGLLSKLSLRADEVGRYRAPGGGGGGHRGEEHTQDRLRRRSRPTAPTMTNAGPRAMASGAAAPQAAARRPPLKAA